MHVTARRVLQGVFVGVLVGLLVVIFGGDVVRHPPRHENRFTLVDAVSAATTVGVSTVGLVGSDYDQLRTPVPRDRELDVLQVEDMVRQAVLMAGGLDLFLAPDANWVVIEPDIVELGIRGSGVVTDWRVVRALIRLVHEAAPRARITIAEGGAWMPPDKQAQLARLVPPDTEVGDGFAIAGFRALLQDPDLTGIDLDIVDLNFDQTYPVQVPGGGYVADQYRVPRTILDCDFLITVPVLKIIGGTGMTAALENLVGIAPGMIYGWPKLHGMPGSGVPALSPMLSIMDEVIADLASVAQADFAVVDALVGMERGATVAQGHARRVNTVLASADVVAADAVAAILIGLNPADLEYLSLAARKGMGNNAPTAIQIDGTPLQQVATRFEKVPSDGSPYGEWGHYGQGCRIWLLAGPFQLLPHQGDEEFIDVKQPDAVPGQNGWSQPVYFHDDQIDLGKYFDYPTNCVAYARADFFVPRSQSAELWVGSDEDLRVWINGKRVYSHQGLRQQYLANDRVPVALSSGWNTVLVRAAQSREKFSFSLNLCEVEPDPRYDGNRVWELRFGVRGTAGQIVAPYKEVKAARPSVPGTPSTSPRGEP